MFSATLVEMARRAFLAVGALIVAGALFLAWHAASESDYIPPFSCDNTEYVYDRC